MATIANRQIEYNRPLTGDTAPSSQTVREASGQSFLRGDLLVFGTGGDVSLCGADPAAIAGMAEDAASGTANTELRMLPNIENATYIMNVLSGASDHVLVIGNIGTRYGIARNSTKWNVDVSDTSAIRVRILGPAPGSNIGDTNARCIVTFLATTRTTAVGWGG